MENADLDSIACKNVQIYKPVDCLLCIVSSFQTHAMQNNLLIMKDIQLCSDNQGLQCLCLFAGLLLAENCCEKVRMENNVTQISREDLEDLRGAFNKIGQCF